MVTQTGHFLSSGPTGYAGTEHGDRLTALQGAARLTREQVPRGSGRECAGAAVPPAVLAGGGGGRALGGRERRVRVAEWRTEVGRINRDAARPGSPLSVGTGRPDQPEKCFLPKAVLERQPDEQLASEPFAAE